MKTPASVAYAALAACLGAGDLLVARVKVKALPKETPCLNCGAPKTHNNCWCSVECKQDWEGKKKLVTWAEKLAEDLKE